MKNIFKSLMTILCCSVLVFSCKKNEAPKNVMTADLTVISDVSAQNPADVSVTLTTNTNWIVTTPNWVTPSATFGSGDAILTFSFASNYKDETTNTLTRSGEIKISGGGSTTGQGVVVIIPVTQLGHTYVDPNPSLGGIPNAEEFATFIVAANSGGSLVRWTDEDTGEIVLLDNIDLADATINWQELADATDVLNANNDCTINNLPFSGIFNGNDYKITGFNPTVQLAANKTFGLFTTISGAVIKNLELSGTMTVSASGQADAGILVGTALNSTISNVKVGGKLISAGNSEAKRLSLGGIFGFACAKEDLYTVIDKCTSDVKAEVDCGNNTANGATCVMYGGIGGFATTPKAIGSFGVTISDCINNGDMDVKAGRCSGILPTANSGTTITGCTNNGNQVNTIPNGRLANIVCNLSYNSKLVNCVNNGDIDATVTDYNGTIAGVVALIGDDTASIEGGGNYGTIKAVSSSGQYIGLLGANFNKFTYVKDMVASGRLIIDGVQQDINATNFMDYVGRINSSYASKVTGFVWVAP